MMDIKYGMYAVRDVKTGFMAPTLDMNDEAAIRNFEHACMRADSLFFTHAADYSLYRIGTYFPEIGQIEVVEPPVHVVDASAFIKKGE